MLLLAMLLGVALSQPMYSSTFLCDLPGFNIGSITYAAAAVPEGSVLFVWLGHTYAKFFIHPLFVSVGFFLLSPLTTFWLHLLFSLFVSKLSVSIALALTSPHLGAVLRLFPLTCRSTVGQPTLMVFSVANSTVPQNPVCPVRLNNHFVISWQ